MPAWRPTRFSQDGGGREDGPASAGAPPGACRLEAPLAEDGARTARGLHGGRRPVHERNLRRALEDAKAAAGLADTADRLSWHALRHSFASILATDLELPATTLARLTGHSDAGFTLKVYARDGRDEASVVEDVLARAADARVGG